MSSVKGSPALWQQFLLDVFAMVKQLGVSTFFVTLSCAYLKWEELPNIINKLNQLSVSDKGLKILS